MKQHDYAFTTLTGAADVARALNRGCDCRSLDPERLRRQLDKVVKTRELHREARAKGGLIVGGPEWSRVNAIMPGVFGTPLLNNMNPKVKESLEASVPFPKRLGKAEEYASLAMEMVRNTYFNGQAVRLDGAIRMAPR